MKIRLLISYDGTDYCGWQRQKAHAKGSPLPNLQGTMEKALSHILGENIVLFASGRTDAGVHALGQVCHFETNGRLPPDLCWALKSQLPSSITIKKAWKAPEEFHATLSAERKTYRYWIWNAPRASALLHRYSWWIRRPLDLDFLNTVARPFVGKHDFESFRTEGSPVTTTVREIYAAQWRRRDSGIFEFSVTGNGFLKQMVRNLVGTQLDLTKRGITAEQGAQHINGVIAARDRRKAGMSAPAQGLFLQRVFYPASLDNKCEPI